MKRNLNLIIILVIPGIALLVNSGSYGVMETNEARYAEIAREMNESGDFLNPLFLNILYYHKPPFTYGLTVLGYKLIGVSNFSARFFLQIAILIQLFLVCQLTMLLFKKKQTALWAALIYFSFPVVLISSRNLTTDTYLSTFVLTSILPDNQKWLINYYKNKKTMDKWIIYY